MHLRCRHPRSVRAEETEAEATTRAGLFRRKPRRGSCPGEHTAEMPTNTQQRRAPSLQTSGLYGTKWREGAWGSELKLGCEIEGELGLILEVLQEYSVSWEGFELRLSLGSGAELLSWRERAWEEPREPRLMAKIVVRPAVQAGWACCGRAEKWGPACCYVGEESVWIEGFLSLLYHTGSSKTFTVNVYYKNYEWTSRFLQPTYVFIAFSVKFLEHLASVL